MGFDLLEPWIWVSGGIFVNLLSNSSKRHWIKKSFTSAVNLFTATLKELYNHMACNKNTANIVAIVRFLYPLTFIICKSTNKN